jgi:hypothetical protein
MRRSAALTAALAALALTAGSQAQDEKEAKPTRRELVAKYGGSDATEAAVTSGLRWLARHQGKKGFWGPSSFTSCCTETECAGAGMDDFKVGVTALATLAVLQAGFLPDSKETWTDTVTQAEVKPGEVVKSALSWLVKQQKDDGAIGPQVGEMMYNQALATRALCEAYRRTQDAESWQEPAQKAVDFLCSAQNFGLGWRYTPKCGNNDTSITAMCVLALRAAKLAKLKVSKRALGDALAWVKRVTDANGRTGYDRLGSGEIYVPGKNESWTQHETMSAAAMLVRIFADKNEDDPILAKQAALLVKDLPDWSRGDHPKIDFYYWYFGTYALFETPGPSSKRWKKWNEAVTTALVEHQKDSGCKEGSWPSDKCDRWGYAGGRVYATAINVLTLEVYYAHDRLFPDPDEKK